MPVSTLFNFPAMLFERWNDVNRSTYPTPPREGVAKRTAKALILGAYKHSGLMRLQEAVRSSTQPPYMTILLFHRVTDQISPDGLTVGTSWFRDFCRLMQANYHVVTLGDMNDLLKSGQAPRRRTVAITFDDCYADNLHAARLLHEHGLPATFFVPTQYVETHLRFPWDQHLPSMPNLTWNDIRHIASLGHDIGSHTVSHADLAKLDDADALKELVDSRAVLEEQLARPVKWFAFPFGSQANFRREQKDLVARAGFEGSVSAIGGTVEMNMLGQVWPREAVPCFRNLTQLELHINRCLDWVYRLKRRVGMLS
jgi:peptidoglycan/xylan/chitin deacetylase (PgdA/CDA1 family)